MKINIGLLTNFLLTFLHVFPSHFPHNYEVKWWLRDSGRLLLFLIAAIANRHCCCRSKDRSAERLLMKGRAFYQKLDWSLVHGLVVHGLLLEHVDGLVVDWLTVDQLLLVEHDDWMVVHHVDRLVLDCVDLLVVDRPIVNWLLVEQWLVNWLIVQLVKQRKNCYILLP